MENTMVLDLEVSWTRSFTIFTHLHLMIMRHDRDVDTHLGCVADLFKIIIQVSSALGRHKIPRERTVSETCYASPVLTIRVRACGLVWNYCTNVVVDRFHHLCQPPFCKDHSSAPFNDLYEPFFLNILIMRFLSLYIVFISFSLALLLSGGVQGTPVSVSNPNAPPRHTEVHRRDAAGSLISAVFGILSSILGSLNLPVEAVQPVQDAIGHVQNLTASLPSLPALPIPALPIPRNAVEAVGVGSSYSSSSTVQANSTASPSQASNAVASALGAHQQAGVHTGRGRHINHRDTTSASAPLSSGSAHASLTSASGSVRVPLASASGKPALAVVPALPVSLPIPNPSLPVPVPVSIPSLPVSPPISVPITAPSPVPPKTSGTTKGKRTHHRS
ncbi:hypothetical protein C8R48DRAFT_837525 [Suillus tomentosus]|nr:hypothetical protein C8R48DRAFT_837525 [Suillus tomentosus]